jgi:hypothetical protein
MIQSGCRNNRFRSVSRIENGRARPDAGPHCPEASILALASAGKRSSPGRSALYGPAAAPAEPTEDVPPITYASNP